MKNHEKSGFTLLELIIALSLLAILSSYAVARFVDLANKAISVQEDVTMRALQSAAILYYARNDTWCCTNSWEDPFTILLENPPPHCIGGDCSTEPMDNPRKLWWIWRDAGNPGRWGMGCPHSWGAAIHVWWFYINGGRLEVVYDTPHH